MWPSIFIDVDGLKRINDTEGHAAGDTLLADVVAAIRERLRAYDLVIRWGGDEFVCVLPDATREEAERTLADIEQHVRDRTSGRSVSTGLAALEDGDTAAEPGRPRRPGPLRPPGGDPGPQLRAGDHPGGVAGSAGEGGGLLACVPLRRSAPGAGRPSSGSRRA